MKDNYGRNIDYMRLSITDRCNMRCRYCMPDGIEMMPVGIASPEEGVANAGMRKHRGYTGAHQAGRFE